MLELYRHSLLLYSQDDAFFHNDPKYKTQITEPQRCLNQKKTTDRPKPLACGKNYHLKSSHINPRSN